MLLVVCCTAFFGFFRVGELTSLTVGGRTPGHCVLVEDVTIDSVHNPSAVKIHLRTSNQYEQGVYVYLKRTGSELCPV